MENRTALIGLLLSFGTALGAWKWLADEGAPQYAVPHPGAAALAPPVESSLPEAVPAAIRRQDRLQRASASPVGAGEAVVFGSYAPSKQIAIDWLDAEGQVIQATFGESLYEVRLPAPAEGWLRARSYGFQDSLRKISLAAGDSKRVDLSLVGNDSIDVYIAGAPDTETFRLPESWRIIALTEPPARGGRIRGLRGGVGQTFGIGRFDAHEEPREVAGRLHIGSLAVSAAGRIWITQVFGSRIAAFDPVTLPGAREITLDWNELLRESSHASVTIELEGEWSGARAFLIDESGGLALHPFTAKSLTIKDVPRGRYLLHVVSPSHGLLVRELDVAGDDLTLGPFLPESNRITLRFIDATTGHEIAFDPELRIDRHFLEILPAKDGSPVEGTMDTGARRFAGPGEDGQASLRLHSGLYRVRLMSPDTGSEFTLVDARQAADVAIGCHSWTTHTLRPTGEAPWRGSLGVIRSGDGNVCGSFTLQGPMPRRIRCLGIPVQIEVFTPSGRLLARTGLLDTASDEPVELLSLRK